MNTMTKTGNFFEVAVRYDKIEEDGGIKKVNETYAIDALSFGEAENRMIKELTTYQKSYQNYEIKAIKIAPYKEIFFCEVPDNADIKYYYAVLSFITIDEKTEKEKRSNVSYLVMAENMEKALKHIHDVMADSTADYESVSLKESKVYDVLMHDDDE